MCVIKLVVFPKYRSDERQCLHITCVLYDSARWPCDEICVLVRLPCVIAVSSYDRRRRRKMPFDIEHVMWTRDNCLGGRTMVYDIAPQSYAIVWKCHDGPTMTHDVNHRRPSFENFKRWFSNLRWPHNRTSSQDGPYDILRCSTMLQDVARWSIILPSQSIVNHRRLCGT